MKNAFIFFCVILFATSAFAMGSVPPETPEEIAYLNNVASFETTIIVSSAEVSDAWGRAQEWVGQYSSMKIQISTDYVLQTYNPPRDDVDVYGYDVTKTKLSDGNYNIKVQCNGKGLISLDSKNRNAHILAYYIKTGVNNPKFIKQ